MRMRKIMAGFMACLLMSTTFATTVFAYSDEAVVESKKVMETDETKEDSYHSEKKNDRKETDEVTTESSYEVIVGEDGKVSIPFDGKEWEIDLGEEKFYSVGKVNVRKGSHLNLREGCSTDYDIVGHLLPGTEVEVLDEVDGWYEVLVPEQNGYVCGKYLDLMEEDISEDEMNLELLTFLMALMMNGNNSEIQNSSGLTPEGNLTLVDDIGPSTGAGQQFITLVTKAGNTFYMVIDRDDDGNENVHFMNLVDEADLFALLDEDTQAAYKESQEPTEPEVPAQIEPVEEPEPTEQPEQEKKSNSWAPLMLLLIAAIAGGGGFLFVSVNKKKKEQEAAKPDPDADYKDEDDEEYEIPEEIEEDDEMDVEPEEGIE